MRLALEIERKFLVVSHDWRSVVQHAARYRQGYLAKTPRGSVRVRRDDHSATLTVKSSRRGLVREEYNYSIPLDEGDRLLTGNTIAPLIEKIRHFVMHDRQLWHVDEYLGAAAGLFTAEIELRRASERFTLPSWVGEEVTFDKSFGNFAIAMAGGKSAARRAAAHGVAPDVALAGQENKL